MKVHIVLRAKNDANGNPRRISLLMDQESVVETFDHGYSGRPRGWPSPVAEIDISPDEYESWIDDGNA